MPDSTNTGRLFCFGDLCIDIIARTPAVDSRVSDTPVSELNIRVAGAASNCAMAAAACGAQVEVLGVAGADSFGVMILKKLKASGVGTSFVRQRAGQTGVIISQVQPNGERSFLSYRGVNAQPYGALPEQFIDPADFVYLSGYSLQHESSAQTALALKALGARCLFDPTYLYARDFQERDVEFLRGIRMVTPNLEEAQLMTGQSSPEDCTAALRDLGIETVIIKLGPQGCYVHQKGVGQLVPTSPATGNINTTGAGDAFCGALLAQCLQGADMIEAATAANDAARKIVCS